jgi:predicted MFS family arabinose efflux permease
MTAMRLDSRSNSSSPLLLVLARAMAPAVGLGIARFAYALVLPYMRADLAWSWTEAGGMNTTNALGYLLGALLAARVIDKWVARASMLGGAIACVVSLALCGKNTGRCWWWIGICGWRSLSSGCITP